MQLVTHQWCHIFMHLLTWIKFTEN